MGATHFSNRLLERAELGSAGEITLILIACNANETIEQMRDRADAHGIASPLPIDEGGRVADAFGTQTTPNVFMLDGAEKVIYQGAADDRTFRQPEPTVNYLDVAVEALIARGAPAISDTPAYSCAIVWQEI